MLERRVGERPAVCQAASLQRQVGGAANKPIGAAMWSYLLAGAGLLLGLPVAAGGAEIALGDRASRGPGCSCKPAAGTAAFLSIFALIADYVVVIV